MAIAWMTLFTEQYPAVGASEDELQSVIQSLFVPLSEQEVQSVMASQANPFPPSDALHASFRPFDPRKWWFPTHKLPESYLSFLSWSNGGSFLNGERRFDPFLSASTLRKTLVGYHVPQHMPGAIPFAWDGGGCFYVFDMRQAPVQGEYPILFVGSGNLGYVDAVPVANSFLECCRGSTNPFYHGMD